LADTIRVEGLSEFLRALDKGDKTRKKEIRNILREVGDDTRKETASLEVTRLGSKVSALGVKTYVRRRGVEIEQSLRKTTGLRPDWGSTQMRFAFLPAWDKTEPDAEARMEAAMVRVAEIINLEV
jgi:hypothetical protein